MKETIPSVFKRNLPNFLLALLCFLSPHWKQSYSASTAWNYQNFIDFPPFQVSPAMNIGYYPFFFKGIYTQSNPTFYFYSGVPIEITTLDCFCPGDRFYLTVNGVQLTPTSVTYVETNNVKCSVYNQEIPDCEASTDYEKNVFSLAPGYYNISVYAFQTFQQNGVGYIRVCVAESEGCASELETILDYRTLFPDQSSSCSKNFACSSSG